MERIGIFGGSFDPVHTGHLLVARAALEELSLQRVIFIPAAQSPLKASSASAPAAERLRLLRLALAGEPRFAVHDLEIRRGGISYTVDTLRILAERWPSARFHYLLGADQAALLPQWREPDELARLTEFAVFTRPGSPTPALPPPFRGAALQGFPFAVSSTDIRARVQAGLPLDGLVPPAVAEAIRNNRLYL